MTLRRVVFLACAALMLVPGASPALALALGAVLALTLGNPFPALSTRGAPALLKASVVGLGFGMSLEILARVGATGAALTAAVVLGTLGVGLWLGRLLGVPRDTALLIASGTGVCGGSAIAAVGSAISARSEAMSAALATVFILNAVALYVFPAVGALLGLSEAQFGVWAALGIHDTSSVVGAAAMFGATALAVATVLKLARALWIVPLAVGAARRVTLHGMPWFVGLFLLAVAVRTMSPTTAYPLLDGLAAAGRAGLVLTLFLIGAGLTRATLARAGGRPFVQGVVLWMLVASATLMVVVWWIPA